MFFKNEQNQNCSKLSEMARLLEETMNVIKSQSTGFWDLRSQKGFGFGRKFLDFSSACSVDFYKHTIQDKKKILFVNLGGWETN